jgi:pyruvate kinase
MDSIETNPREIAFIRRKIMESNGNRKEIASRIRELRESSDTTPEQAALLLGIELPEYLSYEAGDTVYRSVCFII